MRNIKLIIQYDGTGYSGWQSQKNSIAIQDLIESAILKLTGENRRLTGAARTDAGVHAAGQTANFRTDSRIAPERIKDGINSYLPDDIRITSASEVHPRFHSRYDAKKKFYRYSIAITRPVSVFIRKFAAPAPFKLSAGIMAREAKALIGRHDFLSFQGSNSKRVNTKRTIYKMDVKKRGDLIYLDIEADGFLYNMVRIIAGTLMDAGHGRLEKGGIRKILKAGDRCYAGRTAPAKGLCLMEVKY